VRAVEEQVPNMRGALLRAVFHGGSHSHVSRQVCQKSPTSPIKEPYITLKRDLPMRLLRSGMPKGPYLTTKEPYIALKSDLLTLLLRSGEARSYVASAQ